MFILVSLFSFNDYNNRSMTFFTDFTNGLTHLSLEQIIKSFSPLFVTIDILGAIPIILQLRGRGQEYSTPKVALYSGLVLLLFLFAGEAVLSKLGVDISSFGVAGGLILMAMAWEMTFGIEIFKELLLMQRLFPLFSPSSLDLQPSQPYSTCRTKGLPISICLSAWL